MRRTRPRCSSASSRRSDPETLTARRGEILDVLQRFGARNLRVFGSVACGDAEVSRDVDLLVDLEPSRGNVLMRVAGIGEELSQLLGTRVDVVTASLLRKPVSSTALTDAVSLSADPPTNASQTSSMP